MRVFGWFGMQLCPALFSTVAYRGESRNIKGAHCAVGCGYSNSWSCLDRSVLMINPLRRQTGFLDKWMLGVVSKGEATFSLDARSPCYEPAATSRNLRIHFQ
jgi:hypothetical protein